MSVHPAHAHASDDTYHDVMNALSGLHWQTAMQLAIESRQSLPQVKRVLKLMNVKEQLLETARSEDGECYRFGGYSRGGGGA
jgi:hypothetical protein